MNGKGWRGAALVALLGLLAGCGGGGETPTRDTSTQVSPTAVVTVLPTGVPTPGGPHATVLDVVNDVDADPLAEGQWQDAVEEMPIYVDGQVWAQEESTARVSVEQDLVRVAPNTIFTFEQPDGDTLQLDLAEGQVWVNVEGLEPGQTFEVQTPGAVASVRGTRFSARIDAAGATIVSTKVGTVTVSAAGATVTVATDSQTTVPPGDPPDAPAPMSPEEQVRWGMAAGPGLDAHLPAVGAPGTLTYTGYIFSRDWSADGRYFAFTYKDPTAHGFQYTFYDAEAGGTVDVPLASDTTGIFFDPTDDRLAYQRSVHGGTEICLADMAGTTGSCFGGDASYGWPLWSPDGKSLLLYSDSVMLAGRAKGHASVARQDDGAFNLFSLSPDGSERTQLTFSEEGYNIRQNWSHDGERIAYVNAPEYWAPGDVWVMGADGSNPQMLFEGAYSNGYDHVAWSPDDSLLAVPSQEKGLWLIPTDGSEPWVAPGTEGWPCANPVWSPTEDGWPLFFFSYAPDGERVMLWYLLEMGEEPWSLGYPEWGPLWTADGDRLAIGFTVRSGEVPETEIYYFAVEPDFRP